LFGKDVQYFWKKLQKKNFQRLCQLKVMVFAAKVRSLKKIWRRASPNIKVIFAFLLVLFILVQWRQRNVLKSKVTAVSETLTIYRQMRAYSDRACRTKKALADDENIDFLGTVNVEITKAKVRKDVTFIFISQPDLRCAETRLEQLQKKYPSVQIILAFQSLDLFPKHYMANTFPSLKTVLNLGSFSSYPEALQNSILVVRTKYFMLLDSELAIAEMQDNFVQKLMGSMHKFKLLGGLLVNLDNEFVIPCHSLRLRNWTFFEKFEYNISGNVLKCESTSSYFLADTVTLREILVEKPFDASMGIMWRQDFFLRVKELLNTGILPEIIFKKDVTRSCPVVKLGDFKTKLQIDRLLPFVNKYHVLDFVNEDGNLTTICDGSDPMICSEKYIFPKWKLRHWAYSGLTAFPFIVQRLIDALHFGSTQLEKHKISYVLEGGTLLGFIKVRAVLPWDSGDVDTFVYSNRRRVINLVKQIERQHGYEYLLRWNAFHVYVTPHYPMHDGLIVYAVSREDPGELVNIRMHGRLFPVPRSMFKFIREYYGSSYLESRIRFGDERVSCDYEGYQACMPDCRWNGCGSGRGQFHGILN
jgi:hypothetical protein